MRYIDGYLLPVPTAKLAAYQKIARMAGKIWIEHGAVQYCEGAGDDMNPGWGVPFPKAVKLKETETAVFAFVVFKSRADRKKVNAKVMKDPRLMKMCDPKDPIFDMKRMVYGGFTALADLG